MTTAVALVNRRGHCTCHVDFRAKSCYTLAYNLHFLLISGSTITSVWPVLLVMRPRCCCCWRSFIIRGFWQSFASCYCCCSRTSTKRALFVLLAAGISIRPSDLLGVSRECFETQDGNGEIYASIYFPCSLRVNAFSSPHFPPFLVYNQLSVLHTANMQRNVSEWIKV